MSAILLGIGLPFLLGSALAAISLFRDWLNSRNTYDPRLAYGPVRHVVKSGDYTDAELETLRPVLRLVPIGEWPDVVAEYRAQVLHDELDDDAAVAAWLEGRR